MLFGACSTTEPTVVTNEIPSSLLQREPTIERPDVDTGDDTLDFKNAVAYLYQLEDRVQLYEDRLGCINSIVRKEPCRL